MKNVGLLIIATGIHKKLLKNIIQSADKYFLQDHNVSYFLFVDQPIDIESSRSIEQFIIKNEYKNFPDLIKNENLSYLFNNLDYMYCISNSVEFLDSVKEEIFSDIVCVVHDGYLGNKGTPETNKESTAYIPSDLEFQYMRNSFFGGKKDNVLNMLAFIANQIEIDKKKNITAVWRDESHLNKFFILYATKVLGPEYSFKNNSPCIPKIGCLNKLEFFSRTIEKSNTPGSDKIFYCFISHQPYILNDYLRISENMGLLGHENYIIVYGGEKLNIEDKHVIHLNCPDDYCSLPEKVNKAFSYAFNNFKFDYLVKLDRTTYVYKVFDLPLSDYCSSIIKTYLQNQGHWHFNRCPKESKWFNKEYKGESVRHCLGLGYVLSRRAVECVTKDNNFDEHVYEDLYIGSIMYKNKIEPSKFNFEAINYFYDPDHSGYFEF